MAERGAEVERRAREAKEMEKELGPKIEALQKKMEDALGRGDNLTAVYAFEGFMRLQTLAAQHVTGYNYLDEVIRPAVRDFAKNLGVDYEPML
jgi:hypothetical protein